mmetsp:Transcript_17960/g.12968  ORF Transcript_17960/g.12968 Transcript_17960/m.12968 type:complete len:88 (+) Transcript_17960:187-450(+)
MASLHSMFDFGWVLVVGVWIKLRVVRYVDPLPHVVHLVDQFSNPIVALDGVFVLLDGQVAGTVGNLALDGGVELFVGGLTLSHVHLD